MVFFDKDFVNDSKYKIHYDALSEETSAADGYCGLHMKDKTLVEKFMIDETSYDNAQICILKCKSGESQNAFYLDDSILAKEIAPDTWKLVLRKTA